LSLADDVKHLIADLQNWVEMRCEETPLVRGIYPPHEIIVREIAFEKADPKDRPILIGLINKAIAGVGIYTDRSELPSLAEGDLYARFDIKDNELVLTVNDLDAFNEKFGAIKTRVGVMAGRIDRESDKNIGR
jgi:hypothetical protein